MKIRIGLAIFLIANAAYADDPAAAESLFQEGLKFKTQHDYEEACKRFARSEELAPAVGTLLNLGECYEQLHQTARAWLAYRQAITVADANSDKRSERARNEAARLEPRVPHLTVTAPAGVTVTRDGARVEPAALGAAVAVDPGNHVITATAPNRKDWSSSVALAEGAAVTVAVPPLPVEAERTTMVAPAPADDNPRRTIGIAMEIGGGAFLAGGLISGAIALSQWHSVESACPNNGCPRAIAADQQHDVNVARTWATIGTIGIIGGAAVLAAGLGLHVSSLRWDF